MARTEFRFGSHRLAPASRELWIDGRPLSAPPRLVFDLLAYLVAQRDRAVGRDELVSAVWGRVDVTDVQLGQVILRARRLVGDDGQAQRVIRTMPGFGYRWVAPTEEIAIAAPVVTTAAAVTGAVDAAQDTATTPSSPHRHPGERRDPAPFPSVDAAPEASPHRHARDGGHPAPSRRLAPWLAAALMLAAIVIAALALRPSDHANIPTVDSGDTSVATPAPPHDAGTPVAIVLPIDTDATPGDEWLRLGAMDLIAERLRDGGLAVLPSEHVLAMLQALPPDARNDAAAPLRALRATLVVRGHALRIDGGWRFDLVATDAAGAVRPVHAEHADPLRAARAGSDLLLAALGHRDAATAAARDVPEVLQRARAALLANELDAARDLLTQAPQLAAQPIELRLQLAQVDLRAGDPGAAIATLDDVLAQADIATSPLLRARALNARGNAQVRRGEFAAAGRDFDAALALIPPDGPAYVLGHALSGRGITRIAAHRYDDALADLGQARVQLEATGDELGVARIDANLGMLELYRARPSKALEYLVDAADRLEAFGALQEFLFALSGVIDARLSLLQRDEAWASVERAWALRSRIADPDQSVDLVLNRAQALMGMGRYAEAAALLGDAAVVRARNNKVMTARARALRAELAWRTGRDDDAIAAARQALADWPAEGADGDRERVRLLLQRVLLANARADEAATLFARDATAARIDTAPRPDAAGATYHAVAQAEWHRDVARDGAEAAWFRRALAAADRSSVPAETVAVVDAYAPVLLARGELEQASAVIGRVAPWAARDFDCALLQLRLYHALRQPEPWRRALRQARDLAGERPIPREIASAPIDATRSSGFAQQ